MGGKSWAEDLKPMQLHIHSNNKITNWNLNRELGQPRQIVQHGQREILNAKTIAVQIEMELEQQSYQEPSRAIGCTTLGREPCQQMLTFNFLKQSSEASCLCDSEIRAIILLSYSGTPYLGTATEPAQLPSDTIPPSF